MCRTRFHVDIEGVAKYAEQAAELHQPACRDANEIEPDHDVVGAMPLRLGFIAERGQRHGRHIGPLSVDHHRGQEKDDPDAGIRKG